MLRARWILAALALAGACADPEIAPDVTVEDVAPDTVDPPPVLEARFAETRLFAPLGISTGGYAQSLGPDSPTSPFADHFQATTHLLHPPRARALVLSQGENRLVLVQTDLIGIQGRLFERVAQRVAESAGEDVSGELVLMANHTHSGPGHIFNALIADQVTDSYDEQVAVALTDRIAAAVVEALSAPPTPVRAGHAVVTNAALHSDRRCENPEHTNDSMHLLRLDRTDGQGTFALVVNYAMHPTVFSPEDGMLSGDAARAVELGVEEALPSQAPVIFLQSWAGDMSPGSPKRKDGAIPSASIGAFDRLDSLGREAAEAVVSSWDDFRWLDAPVLGVRTELLPVGREILGYGDEFPHEHGAVFCGLGQEACDVEATMSSCLPLPPGEAPDRVRITAIQLGDLALVTLPGEPLTTLGERLASDVLARTGATDALVLGYAQDYTGYLLLPDDWWAGGYEGGFNYWGPEQGLHFVKGATSLAHSLFDPATPLDFDPLEPIPWEAGAGGAYSPTESTDAGLILGNVASEAAPGDELTFSWSGGDPWVDEPSVRLERSADGAFEAARAGARPIDDMGYRIWLTMEPEPPWSDAADQRTFVWTAHLRTGLATAGPWRALDGTYRLQVAGLAVSPGGEIAPYSVLSGEVAVH